MPINQYLKKMIFIGIHWATEEQRWSNGICFEYYRSVRCRILFRIYGCWQSWRLHKVLSAQQCWTALELRWVRVFCYIFIFALILIFTVEYSTGTYELAEDDSVELGTKIVIHLKSDCAQFSQEDTIKGNW